jgi:hypothetical protein
MFILILLFGKAFGEEKCEVLFSEACCGKISFGDVAQLGERYVRNVQVRGSNPLISTSKYNELEI